MDYEGINAGNIAINSEILENVMLIATGESSTSGSTDNTRALAMVELRDFAMNLSSLETGKNLMEHLMNIRILLLNILIQLEIFLN